MVLTVRNFSDVNYIVDYILIPAFLLKLFQEIIFIFCCYLSPLTGGLVFNLDVTKAVARSVPKEFSMYRCNSGWGFFLYLEAVRSMVYLIFRYQNVLRRIDCIFL